MDTSSTSSSIPARHWSFSVNRQQPSRAFGRDPRDYTATAVTANGKIKAAPAKIDRIEIGGITVFDVPAMVLPDEALSKNLLGVSFLSRLRRYEYANGRLLLEQ